MKIAAKHLLKSIRSSPSIEDLSKKLFQLGHEHELENGIFDIELTPNRGDCLSIDGLLRDLAAFYEINSNKDTYNHDLGHLDLNFVNNAKKACPYISFLKIDIEGDIKDYSGSLKEYFSELKINKNNFFTDVSNYISYETGQPTHCYDAKKIKNDIILKTIKGEQKFETLLDKKIDLKDENLVFIQGKDIINLAGIMGSKNTACSKKTKSVIIECAFFNTEYIIGKSIKYDINSEAAYKFERGVDPSCHENVLRRFLKVVESHANIKNVEFVNKDCINFKNIEIPSDFNRVNKILGINIAENTFKEHLQKLGFSHTLNNTIMVPSYRHDIKTINDIAEEIARVIGYDNIPTGDFEIPTILNKKLNFKEVELEIKNYLVDNGFFEVVNSPFQKNKSKNSIEVDNPLDTNRKYLRTGIKNSLLENLLYNERRQKDSIKLFEISDVYFYSGGIQSKRVIGIIASGRVKKNYLDFSKKIDQNLIEDILKTLPKTNSSSKVISRDDIDTKIKNKIVYFETEIENFKDFKYNNSNKSKNDSIKFIKYNPISEYPSSIRDLSFLVKDPNKCDLLQQAILNFSNEFLKEVFIFDFFTNNKNNVVKIGFRFVFQSKTSTITDLQVNKVINQITDLAFSIGSIEIPGLTNKF